MVSTALFLAAAFFGAASAEPDAGAPPNGAGKYRIWFTKTYGDDHICLTEVEFYGDDDVRLNASFVSMSSCYGCNSCNDCKHRYGNPQALFDKDASSDGPNAWLCTAPGTFNDGIGSQSLVFSLNAEPKRYVLQRPQVNGDWVTKDYSLEQEVSDGNWQLIDIAVDTVKRPDQSRAITMVPQPVIPPPVKRNPPWSYATVDAWVDDYPTCGGLQQSPIALGSNFASNGSAKLPFSYKALSGRALANTGTTLQIAGKFGNLTLADGVYAANNLHFHFPPEHQVGGEDSVAIGEMQIVHQKIGSKGPVDLAIVSIMLHLPLEAVELNSEERFFVNMGLLAIPAKEAYSSPLAAAVDLNTLNEQLSGNFWQYTGSLATPPCTEGVQWFVMEKPAEITGVVVQQFKAVFPSPANARPLQSSNGRVVNLNTLPGGAAAAPAEEAAELKKDAAAPAAAPAKEAAAPAVA